MQCSAVCKSQVTRDLMARSGDLVSRSGVLGKHCGEITEDKWCSRPKSAYWNTLNCLAALTQFDREIMFLEALKVQLGRSPQSHTKRDGLTWNFFLLFPFVFMLNPSYPCKCNTNHDQISFGASSQTLLLQMNPF